MTDRRKPKTYRVGFKMSGAEVFLQDDFNQDDLAGRYGNARDRQVVEKPRHCRSKLRRVPRA